MKESEGLYRGFRFLKRLLIGVVVLLLGMGVVGYTLFMRRVDARGAWSAASREISGGMLSTGSTSRSSSKLSSAVRPTTIGLRTAFLSLRTSG